MINNSPFGVFHFWDENDKVYNKKSCGFFELVSTGVSTYPIASAIKGNPTLSGENSTDPDTFTGTGDLSGAAALQMCSNGTLPNPYGSAKAVTYTPTQKGSRL